ncbi:hypothetical protein BT69DRAFT_706829 [Atractiella rhizophila]|nr:hypothetical protein BT69DRAFT_706829 [Atractiella rhizophila]
MRSTSASCAFEKLIMKKSLKLVLGIISVFFWWDARSGDLGRQRTVHKLRFLAASIPWTIVSTFFTTLLFFYFERSYCLRTGKPRLFNLARYFGPDADYSMISKEYLLFPLIVTFALSVLTFYKLVIFVLVLVPTPQDASAYPLPMELFYSTVRSRTLFYILQLLMECIAISAFAFFDLRRIYGLGGHYGIEFKRPEKRNPATDQSSGNVTQMQVQVRSV